LEGGGVGGLVCWGNGGGGGGWVCGGGGGGGGGLKLESELAHSKQTKGSYFTSRSLTKKTLLLIANVRWQETGGKKHFGSQGTEAG